MGTTSSLRIDDDLYASAKLVGEVASRSAAQQVAHWALIGRELEASGHIGVRDVDAVLTGRADYDSLSVREQAVVRAAWSERIGSRIDELDLEARFTAEGRPFVELDEQGDVVERRP
ncbi:TA system antitoxin ParD family protein [Williamsia herbipolensis]|uniref:TA system antitoxin ParD family protein n=1 Tax=Williamsia herbipolensis TaxID=1603258 RepID=UPI0009E2634B|nr:hypothetical protein [Williamsia herbipolensis]